ncbi:type IX secretion system ring subunit PorN/GldN [Sinomicrobium soli]|uniref:type IX secretion system ring protein PorN/GldN n=1 Tax=Sinomicrobium sp. N-1-3-6 TaxID=2219864 RepID=UPI000DCF1311|nr:gliding motility protein GldN [Sinomicrobium sp. N-1-3-6]RAV29932.1 gliding motility protein GldN [Sinomicrobium sp. N-1-3-6]
MCWKGVLSICIVLTVWDMNGQANILNAQRPEDIGVETRAQASQDNDVPLEYGYVEDRDIMWSKMVWEVVDLNERVNFPLYYPIDGTSGALGRKSLYDVLVTNIKNGKLKDIYTDSYFTERRNFGELEATLAKVDTTDLGYEQVNAGEQVSEMYIDRREISAADIVEYRIRGMWYFDKRQGELKYRLLGIAPVAPDVNFMDEGMDDGSNLVELFWVWYPSAREVLHEAKAFNANNSGVPISFDHLLNARRFNAVIYKEDNVYGDREIRDYIPDNAMFQLMEAQRIQGEIRNFEQDVWKNE